MKTQPFSTTPPAGGIAAEGLIAGAHRSTLAELTEWTTRTDKALVF